MATMLNQTSSAAQRVIPESLRPTMAKADLRKADDWRERVGGAIQRAMSLRGWSLKEFSSQVGRDARQCARWIAGTERPQLDALFAVESFRQPLIVALSELAGAGVEIETVITVRSRERLAS